MSTHSSVTKLLVVMCRAEPEVPGSILPLDFGFLKPSVFSGRLKSSQRKGLSVKVVGGAAASYAL